MKVVFFPYIGKARYMSSIVMNSMSTLNEINFKKSINLYSTIVL